MCQLIARRANMREQFADNAPIAFDELQRQEVAVKSSLRLSIVHTAPSCAEICKLGNKRPADASQTLLGKEILIQAGFASSHRTAVDPVLYQTLVGNLCIHPIRHGRILRALLNRLRSR